MLYHVTVLDDNQSDVPYMIFAVHAPEGTPERIIQQACIDAINAGDELETKVILGDKDTWDGQLDDPACTWVINEVEPLRISVPRVAQYWRQLKLGLGVPPYEPLDDDENRKRTFMPRPKGPRDKR